MDTNATRSAVDRGLIKLAFDRGVSVGDGRLLGLLLIVRAWHPEVMCDDHWPRWVNAVIGVVMLLLQLWVYVRARRAWRR